jgi:hypothetical protein
MVHDALAKTRLMNCKPNTKPERKDNVIKLLVKKHETNRWRIIGLILGLLLVVCGIRIIPEMEEG